MCASELAYLNGKRKLEYLVPCSEFPSSPRPVLQSSPLHRGSAQGVRARALGAVSHLRIGKLGQKLAVEDVTHVTPTSLAPLERPPEQAWRVLQACSAGRAPGEGGRSILCPAGGRLLRLGWGWGGGETVSRDWVINILRGCETNLRPPAGSRASPACSIRSYITSPTATRM